MPIKSKAQWRRFAAMLRRGEISRAKFDEWTHGVSFKSLPERVQGKKKRKRSKRKRSKRK